MTRPTKARLPGPSRVGLAVLSLAFAGCSSDGSSSFSGGGAGTGGLAVNATGGAAGAGPSGSGGTAAGGSANGGTGATPGSGSARPIGGATGQGGTPTVSTGGAMGQAGSSGGASMGGSVGATGNGGASMGGSAGATGNGGVSPGGAGGASTGGPYWKPTAGTTWQWQLTGTIDTKVDVAVYDIDGFDNDASTVKKLHDQGRKVICYLSVGSYEDWRPDASKFPASVLGKDYPGWPGEKFVDIRAKALRDIMAARFDICKQKGFDGVEPDNMDVYENNSGFPLTQKDGEDYANWMATEVHARGMNIGQKNASELADTLQPTYDWVLTEDCYDQGWCADVQTYVSHDKPVFMSEYTDTNVDFNAACAWAKPKKYSPILKGRDLDAPVQFCP